MVLNFWFLHRETCLSLHLALAPRLGLRVRPTTHSEVEAQASRASAEWWQGHNGRVYVKNLKHFFVQNLSKSFVICPRKHLETSKSVGARVWAGPNMKNHEELVFCGHFAQKSLIISVPMLFLRRGVPKVSNVCQRRWIFSAWAHAFSIDRATCASSFSRSCGQSGRRSWTPWGAQLVPGSGYTAAPGTWKGHGNASKPRP